jgi:hypothetical protein
VALPSHDTTDGTIALAVAGVITAGVAVVIVLRNRATNRTHAARDWPNRPGSVVPRRVD